MNLVDSHPRFEGSLELERTLSRRTPKRRDEGQRIVVVQAVVRQPTRGDPTLPTDLQAQLMTLLSRADGVSLITEKVYPDRFMHIAELNRLGARIRKEGPTAIIEGVKRLSGAEVMASDLRASACLVIAAVVAEGQTEVHRIYHLDRGYVRMERKLADLGADITREYDESGV